MRVALAPISELAPMNRALLWGKTLLSDPQPQSSQFFASGFIIRVQNAANPQAFRDLDEHRCVFEINDLPGRRLGDVKRKAKYLHVGFAELDEAGGNKRIHKFVQLELLDSIRVDFARFVADHGDLQPVSMLESNNEIKHFGIRFGLRAHKTPKLRPCECAFFIKNDPVKILSKSHPPLLVGFEVQGMAVLRFGRIQLEMPGRTFSGVMIPTISQQDLANIHK